MSPWVRLGGLNKGEIVFFIRILVVPSQHPPPHDHIGLPSTYHSGDPTSPPHTIFDLTYGVVGCISLAASFGLGVENLQPV